MKFNIIINMKRIVIVRHAKAESINLVADDYYRSLTLKGIDDAKNVAKRINSLDIKPDYIISSPANRALETAEIFAEEFNYPVNKIKYNRDIYDNFNTVKILKQIRDADNNINTFYIFGHNPSLTYFVNILAKTTNISMQKSAVAAISFDIDSWKDIKEFNGKLMFYEHP